MRDASRYTPYLGTRWSESGASLLQLLGPETEVRVTAPPRETAVVGETSRVLRVSLENDHYVVLLSHR